MRVRFYGLLRDFVADRALTLPIGAGETVRSVLQHLAAQYPAVRGQLFDASGQLRPYLLVAKNGIDIRSLRGPTEPVSDRDDLAIFPPSSGG